MGKPRAEQVIFRLTADEHRQLLAYADARGQSAGQAARDLTLAGLRGASIIPPAFVAARRAAFAVIVALSPDLDETATDAFLKEVYDQ
ncbi:MAG: hypothetical protein U0746_10200 [Gemmataceae bacterium]